MKPKEIPMLKFSVILILAAFMALSVIPSFAEDGDVKYAPGQQAMTLEEYLGA